MGDSGVTASRWLASDVQYLFLTLGILASFSTQKIHNGKLPNGRRCVDTSWYNLKLPYLTTNVPSIMKTDRRLNNLKLIPVSCLPSLIRNFSYYYSKCRVTESILKKIDRLNDYLQTISKGDAELKTRSKAA
ncbi:hypothetical protein KEJ48_05970, partial [Candidatus Bathyarchaeota archaeon]|nr:hypothetical protein [Candidatus Bathyarchaeota archaeon]